MFAIIQAAGWPIWFLLFASIIAVALIIERSVSLRQKKVIPPELLNQAISVYQRQGVSDEVLAKLEKDSPLGVVLAAALRNHKSSRFVMKEAIEEAGRGVTHQLERANEIAILVNAHGQYVINHRPVIFRNIEGLADEMKRAGAALKDPVVVISADAAATHQAVIRIMEAARLAGLSQITFTTQTTK